jgi:hypothetical protein
MVLRATVHEALVLETLVFEAEACSTSRVKSYCLVAQEKSPRQSGDQLPLERN